MLPLNLRLALLRDRVGCGREEAFAAGSERGGAGEFRLIMSLRWCMCVSLGARWCVPVEGWLPVVTVTFDKPASDWAELSPLPADEDNRPDTER